MSIEAHGDCIRINSHALGQKLGVQQTAKNYRRVFRKTIRKSRKHIVRYGLLTFNVLLLTLVIVFVINNPNASQAPQQNSLVNANSVEAADNPLDQLSSADIAVNVASVTGMTETTAVRNQADSENAQLSLTPADDKVVARPQVVVTARKSNKDIQVYKVKDGDSVSSIAANFNVSSDSLRWSNGLTGNDVTVGSEIVIPPSGLSGIVYTVKAGDTPESLAEKYRTNKDLIIAYNDAEISGLKAGERIIIPDGQQPVQNTYTGGNTGIYSGNSFAWGGFAPIYGSNGYDYGYCTWYAAVRRAQAGKPLPSNLGNASSWKILAQRAGFGVGGTPAAGAVIWTPPRDYYGHVGYVEAVDPDGTVHVAEMNVAGWGVVSKKTLTPEQAAGYGYIY